MIDFVKQKKVKYKKIISIVTISIICISIILLLYSCKKDEPITEFSAENWRSVEWEQRYHMLEDLYAEVELVGMTSDEVEQLLGQYGIRCEAYWSDMGKCDYHWGYSVRYDSWEGYEYLLINFKDDIVVSYELEYGSDL